MRIEKVNQQQVISMKKGLYFAKGNPLFNKEYDYLQKAGTKISEDGFRFKEDLKISNEVKEKFANIPFIKKLSEQFDTFISYTGVTEVSVEMYRPSFFEKADIFWANPKYKSAKQASIGTISIKSIFPQKTLFDLLENDKDLNKKLEKFEKSHFRFSCKYLDDQKNGKIYD